MIALAKNLQIPSKQGLAQLLIPQPFRDLLEQMKKKHEPTFEHLRRVGDFCWLLGKFTGSDATVLRLAGLMHDIGVLELPTELLGKKDWNNDVDKPIMRQHVMIGYNMLTPKYQLIAHITVRHHTFQKEDPYPKPEELPPLTGFFEYLYREEIERLAKLLAIADDYDALHRKNNRHGNLTGPQIRQKMMEDWADEEPLINGAYEVQIFTEEDY